VDLEKTSNEDSGSLRYNRAAGRGRDGLL
jgi:hypothetical protein